MRNGQVAAKLNISPSTLRRWTDRFAEFLSEGATQVINGNGHGQRDYTETDILVLGAIQAMRERGLDDDSIWEELQAERDRSMQRPSARIESLARLDSSDEMALMAPQAAAAALAMAMRQLSETQQALLNSQQSHRDLLGVVVQDNFNLKEENSRLRKQMRQLEQEVSQLKESDWNQRLSLEERLTMLEKRKKSWWERLLGR